MPDTVKIINFEQKILISIEILDVRYEKRLSSYI
jgi:hypothetical protein